MRQQLLIDLLGGSAVRHAGCVIAVLGRALGLLHLRFALQLFQRALAAAPCCHVRFVEQAAIFYGALQRLRQPGRFRRTLAEQGGFSQQGRALAAAGWLSTEPSMRAALLSSGWLVPASSPGSSASGVGGALPSRLAAALWPRVAWLPAVLAWPAAAAPAPLAGRGRPGASSSSLPAGSVDGGVAGRLAAGVLAAMTLAASAGKAAAALASWAAAPASAAGLPAALAGAGRCRLPQRRPRQPSCRVAELARLPRPPWRRWPLPAALALAGLPAAARWQTQRQHCRACTGRPCRLVHGLRHTAPRCYWAGSVRKSRAVRR
jgi:hypothetical protein